MYKRGSLAEYEAEHLQAQINDGWTQEEIDEGKMTYCMDEPAPEMARTIKKYSPIEHPETPGDYIWESADGTLSLEDVKTLGWFPEVEE